MINSRTIFMGILLAIMVVGLSGCKITSASPDPGTVIEMKPGDKKLFKVVGPVNTATTKCIWYVAKMNSDYIGDLDYKNEQMVLERSNKYEFTVDPNGEQTNRIKIRCEYWSYEFGPDPNCMAICFYIFDWRLKGSRTWNIRILPDTSPVWQGNYYIENSRDVDLLKDYATVTGSLIVRGNVQNLEVLDNLTSVGKNILIGGEGQSNAITSLSGLRNLTSVSGYLSIYNNPALTSLSGLENITSVGGGLGIISNNALTNLFDLENLTSVGGSLGISDNGALTNLSGLENITSVGGGLGISGNDTLTSLSGLENISSVGGSMMIYNNPALTSLSALENLTSVGGFLQIEYNPTLTSLSGLENLTSVSGYLNIYNNPALTSLSGLENITSVGSLYIGYSTALTNLSGLENLTSVSGSLGIANNDALTSLSGLENLTSVGGYLDIRFNNALTTLSGLENLTSVGGGLYIEYNAVLTALEMAGLQRIDGDFEIIYNPLLCTSSAEDLMNQILAGGGIGGTKTISGNKDCTTP